MSPRQANTALGLGLGLAAAGAATAAGIAADRLTKSRKKALSTLGPRGSYDHTPDKELVVVATDGVPLHVEVDEPEAEAVPLLSSSPTAAAVSPTAASDDSAPQFDRMSEEDLLRGLENLAPPVETDDEGE